MLAHPRLTMTLVSQLDGGAYIVVHLRGESDWPPGWGNADQQMSLYEAEMLKIRETVPDGEGVSAVYVSSGDQQSIQNFRERLEPLDFTVHDKWTILQEKTEELALVDAMDFDTKGIIDCRSACSGAVLYGGKFVFLCFSCVSLLFPQRRNTQANPDSLQIFVSTMSKYIAYTRTADEEEDFFDTYIFSGSSIIGAVAVFAEPFKIRGNQYTMLIVTDGYYIMDSFP